MNFIRNPQFVFAILSLVLVAACESRSPELQTTRSNDVIRMDEPLSRFDQELTTIQKELVFKPGQTITVAITIRNITGVALVSTGRFPITVSYKWFDDGKILPIEGDRTLLPMPLHPNDQTVVYAKVTAPQSGSSLVVRFSLVQEGVSWFFSKGGRTLNLPVHLEP
jgi:hypothetical protein